MNRFFKIPPKSVKLLTKPNELANCFSALIGQPFSLTGKTRTDGSNMRKLVATTLEKSLSLPELADQDEFEIVPPKSKGVPKIILVFVDTYIVTSGTSYNLQVWNRLPAAESLLVKYTSGESLKCSDVRFVLVKIDIQEKKITSILTLTPDYIELRFGKFGRPTIKHQLLISEKVRKKIYEKEDKILFFPDTEKLSYFIRHDYTPPQTGMAEEPTVNNLFSIRLLKNLVAEKLIGYRLEAGATKNRGQALEKKVLELLSYDLKEAESLYGSFPDIRNQLLEVKIQDSPTVDLGKFSPEIEEVVVDGSEFTTFDVRYLIALTNPKTEIIEGIILAPGQKLGEIFSYVSSENYKCQRSIPMAFFEKYDGKSVFNPD